MALLLWLIFVEVNTEISVTFECPTMTVMKLPGFSHLLPFRQESSAAHKAAAALIFHGAENDIQFTEISLLHRHHRQSGLIAEIDASCPRLASKHIHPPPQSHFSVKQQLTPNRSSSQEVVIVECIHEVEVTVAKGLRDGGTANILSVNYTLDFFPSETPA